MTVLPFRSKAIPLDIGHEFETVDPLSEAADRRESIGLATGAAIFAVMLMLACLAVLAIGLTIRAAVALF